MWQRQTSPSTTADRLSVRTSSVDDTVVEAAALLVEQIDLYYLYHVACSCFRQVNTAQVGVAQEALWFLVLAGSFAALNCRTYSYYTTGSTSSVLALRECVFFCHGIVVVLTSQQQTVVV